MAGPVSPVTTAIAPDGQLVLELEATPGGSEATGEFASPNGRSGPTNSRCGWCEGQRR
jgi:hypothetical protein